MQRGWHPNDEELAAWLLDGAADERVRIHAQHCAICQQTAAELAAIGRALRSLPAPALPRSFTLTREELARLRPEPWYRVWQRLFRRVALVTATAFALLLFAGASLALLLPPVMLATPTAAAAPRMLQAQAIASSAAATPASGPALSVARVATVQATPAEATFEQASTRPDVAPTASVTIRPTPLLYDARWHFSLLVLGLASLLSLGLSILLPAVARRG
ncbi:MAG: hypothetical protein IRY86_09050 [Thermorudis peleae]|nr:hypothetical protein [Thermorudis peleae]